MDWPAYSPDLNPIEHVYDALGRRIAARLHHPENTQQLKQMLIEEWALLPQEMLHQLVLSMRKRCEATIAERETTRSILQEQIHPQPLYLLEQTVSLDSPLKNLKKATIQTLSPTPSVNTILAIENARRKRKRVQSKTVPLKNCGGGGRNFDELIHTAACMVLNDRPTTGVLLAPCHDEFRGSRSDYVRQSQVDIIFGDPFGNSGLIERRRSGYSVAPPGGYLQQRR
ncbi:transposable element Tcb2 transposase [Trichonephila clavipes]|nr:transposable element Tcb2 transposase [Trichonephila clavipes]